MTDGRGLRARVRGLEYRNEIVAVIVLIVGTQLLPRTVPLGLYVDALLSAPLLVLHAIALLLVYRSNRFLNFAQVQLGAFCGTLFGSLVVGQWLLGLVRVACGCVDPEPAGVSVAVNVVAALVVAFVGGPGLAYLFYVTLVRRFATAPRITATVFTFYTAQALFVLGDQLRTRLAPPTLDRELVTSRAPRIPGGIEWRIDAFAVVRPEDVLAVAAALAAIVGLSLYLKRANTGVAIRAAAENPGRAETVGVAVDRVTGRVWLVAGLLAATSGVLGVMTNDFDPTAGFNVGDLVILVVAVVVARFRSLPVAAVATTVLVVVRTTVTYSFGSPIPFDAVVGLLVGLLLLVQRGRQSRAEREDVSGFETTRETRPIPRELRHLPQVRRAVRNIAVSLVLLLLLFPWVLPRGDVGFVTTFVILSILGLSLLVVTGWSGQVSLGQAAFAGIGAWAAAVSGLPYPLAVLLGAAAGAVGATLVGVPALRLGGLALAVSTLAFALSVHAFFLRDRYLGVLIPRDVPAPALLGMSMADPRLSYYFHLVVVAAVALGVHGLRKTRTGRMLIAVRANGPAAQAFGVSPVRARLTAFAIGGFLAGLAGALLTFHSRVVVVDAFDAGDSIEVFLYTAVGGMGGITGPFLGFAYLALVSLSSTNVVIKFLSLGVGGMLLLIVVPGGLAQVVYGVRDSALRRLAVRLRIPVPALMGDRAAAATLDRVQLDGRRRNRALKAAVLMNYMLPQQWALDRFGKDVAVEGAAARANGVDS